MDTLQRILSEWIIANGVWEDPTKRGYQSIWHCNTASRWVRNGTSTKASFEAGIVCTKAFFCVGDKAATTTKKKCTFDKLLKEMKEGGVAMIKERIDCLSKEFENGGVGSGRHKRAKKCLIALEFT